jgi:serine phosphatase RsbU (regulator of sigma subunit)
MTPSGRSLLWLRGLLAAGAVLGIVLLVQTVVNYRYVADSLIRQSARRAADDRVRDVERAARLTRPQDAAGFQVVLDEVRGDAADQIAEVALLQGDGSRLAASPPATMASPQGLRRPGERTETLVQETRDGRSVFVGVFPCRCSLPRRVDGSSGPSRDGARLQVQLALYEDSLSAPFSRLRRNAIISASAAFALLVASALIAARASTYMRGRQLDAELDLARQVQRDLLPAPESLPKIDVAVACLPASQVGGDFYDAVSLPDGRVSFVLGDVSGHGLTAALLMALVHGAMSNPPWGTSESPERSAARLNDLLLAKSSGSRFVSVFWCAYDAQSRTLSYLNAGHPPPVLLRTGAGAQDRQELLSAGGPVIGLITSGVFPAAQVIASPGDLLLLVSDGITEAPDAEGRPYGDDRLFEVFERSRTLPASAIRDAILASVAAFTGHAPPLDDRTLLVVRLPDELHSAKVRPS